MRIVATQCEAGTPAEFTAKDGQRKWDWNQQRYLVGLLPPRGRMTPPAATSARRTAFGETPNRSPSWASVDPPRYNSAAVETSFSASPWFRISTPCSCKILMTLPWLISYRHRSSVVEAPSRYAWTSSVIVPADNRRSIRCIGPIGSRVFTARFADFSPISTIWRNRRPW
jgi:hypothetical protein